MESNFSDVGICNSGLLKCGARQISSLSDNTRASNVCAQMYPILRDEVLRAVPWRFALEQAVLGTPAAVAPAFDYTSAYDIPSEMLRVWKVNANSWTQIGQQILCNNNSGINVLAIFQNTDPTTYDAQFAEALAWRIAMEISMALVQSAPLAAQMEKGYEKSIALARSTNAVIGTPERLIADLWSGARKYGFEGTWAIDAGPPEPYGN